MTAGHPVHTVDIRVATPGRAAGVTASPVPPIPAIGDSMLTLTQLSPDQARSLVRGGIAVKSDPALYANALHGRSGVMLFEKPSLRTRVSFEVGIGKLGGRAVYLDHNSVKIGERETVEDYASNLSLWCDIIIARVFDHRTLERLAEAASVPVVNALSDLWHPCQSLADWQSLCEVFGEVSGLAVAFVGDGNNVCRSLLVGGALLGAHVSIVCPDGYGPARDAIDAAAVINETTGGSVTVTDQMDAVAGAAAVYTDTWISMGSQRSTEEVRTAMRPYQVTGEVMRLAGEDAVFMHCLPATRGVEVAADVLDGPRSIVLRQAENRMHAQNALLLSLLQALGENG